MLMKKILGVFILILNFSGLIFLLYVGVMAILNKFFGIKQQKAVQKPAASPRKKSTIKNDNIILEEDDLLKDMDLSDLDNLDLDDFE